MVVKALMFMMVFILPSCPNLSPVSDSLHGRNTPSVQTHFILEETNGVLKVEFSLQLTRQGMRFLEMILLESPMSFSPSETANSKLAH